MRTLLLTTILMQMLSMLPAAPHAALRHGNPWLADPRTRIVRITEAGVVSIPWATLAASGWVLDAQTMNGIQVWRQGQQIPIMLTTTGIQFLATANESPFSRSATYWIVVGSAAGLRTTLPSLPTQPFVWEIDRIFQSMLTTSRGDSWFAGEVRTTGALSIDLTLPTPLTIGSPIEIALSPFVLGQHTLTVWHGAAMLGETTWNDSHSGPRTIRLVTNQALPAGPVTLRLTLTAPTEDIVFIDAVNMPTLAVPLPTLTPIIEQPMPAPAIIPADQQIIAHPDLIAALQPLVEAKAHQGMTVAITDVTAIYDSFSWGERDPAAIRAWIQVVAAHAPPTSILLVGDGTARLREEDPALRSIPPYLIAADPVVGVIACDTCYTRLDADDPRHDGQPDIPIGRFPARTPAEASVLVAKTIAALHPLPGSWRTRMLLVADNDHEADRTPDPAGPFQPILHAIAAAMPAYQAAWFRYTPDQPATTGNYPSVAALRQDLFAAWDAGAAVIAYSGHASAWQWGWTGPNESVPHILTRSDAVRRNSARLPLLLSMTCLSGSLQQPTLSAIDMELVLQADGGVAAALSASGSGVNTQHRTMLAGILPVLARGDSIGSAHLAGIAALLQESAAPDLAYSFNLLGDPALTLPPSVHQVALPEVVR